MTEPPPLGRDQTMIDRDHLRLLAIFHFIIAALSVVGLGFIFLHYVFLHVFFDNPTMWKNQAGGGPPVEFVVLFRWFYFVFAILVVAGGLANLLSGLFLRRRVNRTFSFIVAGMNCLQFPFGTALGVFTFIVLLRDSVRDVYEATRR